MSTRQSLFQAHSKYPHVTAARPGSVGPVADLRLSVREGVVELQFTMYPGFLRLMIVFRSNNKAVLPLSTGPPTWPTLAMLCCPTPAARVTAAWNGGRVVPICSSMCLTRVRPASLGNKDNAKACESDAPSQWGIKPVSVAVGSWRCQPVVQTRAPWGYSGTVNNHQSAWNG